MIDVERIRRAAVTRIRAGRVGMVLTCRQVLELIERGDGQARISGVEQEGEQQLEALPTYPDRPPPERYIRTREAAALSGVSANALAKLARKGKLWGRKTAVVYGNGRRHYVWWLDAGEVRAYGRLSHAERLAVGRGTLNLRRGEVANG